MTQCLAQPCDANMETSCRGYCMRHYRRLLKYGDPYEVAFTYLKFDSVDLELHFWRQASLTANDEKCWEWQGDADKDGYGRIRIDGKRFRAHRLAFFFEHKRHPSDDLQVLHSCDNPCCINPKHLREGTPQDNADDVKARHRQYVSPTEKHYNAELEPDTVRYVKRQKQLGRENIAIARELDISNKMVWDIDHGKSWKHITI